MKYAFIQNRRKQFKVTSMCGVLGVSCSGFYDWLGRPPSQRALQNVQILKAIQQTHKESRGAYGSDKTWRTLKSQGIACGRHRVARLRGENGIVSRRRKRFTVQRDYRRRTHIAPNRLDRQFDLAKRPNQIWVGDVTLIPTRAGWLYLAIILDLCTRQIVGWAMSACQNRALVCEAIAMAVTRRKPRPGLLHHTDQGSIYASQEYQTLLAKHQMIPSMSRAGNCYDNAVAESFFSTLKNELVHGSSYINRAEARSAIFEYIEVFYNRQRLHQGLNYITPQQAEMSAC